MAVPSERVRQVIERLESEVPRDGARVQIAEYGGPDELMLIANDEGYLRLGLEFMKAAYASLEGPEGSDHVSVDLEYLIVGDAPFPVDFFVRRDPQQVSKSSETLLDRAMPAIIVGGCAVIVALAIIGAYATYRWLGF